MSVNYYWLVAGLSVLMIACGGGSQGGTEYDTSQPDSAQQDVDVADAGQSSAVEPSTPESAVEPTIERFAELNVAEPFAFTNQQPLAVIVSLTQPANRYLNLCTQWQSDQQIHRSSCLWRGALQHNQTEIQLQLGAHHQQLIAELWRLDRGQLDVEYQVVDIIRGQPAVFTF